MFDIGWTELLVIGVVALIVIGPKDLPEMFRQLGRFTAKIRSMARDFQRAMDQAAKESGAGDVVKDLKTMTSANNLGLNAVKDAADKFEKWDPLKPAAKGAGPTTTPPAAAKPPETSAAKPPEVGPATRALREKQAARKAILQETAEKLKALKDPAPAAAASAPAPAASAPAKRTGARKAAASATGSAAAAAPKAPKTRKTGKTEKE